MPGNAEGEEWRGAAGGVPHPWAQNRVQPPGGGQKRWQEAVSPVSARRVLGAYRVV